MNFLLKQLLRGILRSIQTRQAKKHASAKCTSSAKPEPFWFIATLICLCEDVEDGVVLGSSYTCRELKNKRIVAREKKR